MTCLYKTKKKLKKTIIEGRVTANSSHKTHITFGKPHADLEFKPCGFSETNHIKAIYA